MPEPSQDAVARHPHLAEERRPGHVRVDMHLHTMWSGDATTTPDELRDAVTASGIDVVCITDHGTINGAIELQDQLGCRVIVGEEVRTQSGEIIGLFLTERLPFGLSAEDAADRIRSQGGVVYVPHPFDPVRHSLAPGVLDALARAGKLDAVEVFNAKVSLQHLNEQAADFAAEHGLLAGAGSDAHEPTALGASYVEVPDFDDPQSFLRSLESARVIGHQYDRPREWRPRVVPSTRAL